MPKSKLLFGALFLVVILFAANTVAAKPGSAKFSPYYPGEQPVLRADVALPPMNRITGADEDDFYTLRWFYSSDGGVNWNGPMNAGDAGMLDVNPQGETVAVWSSFTDLGHGMGVVVNDQNHLHFIVVLDNYSDLEELNPYNRENGVYDVVCDLNGENVSWNLISAQTDLPFIWSDAAINADGHIYAIWQDLNLDDETSSLWGSKSTNDGVTWSQPVALAQDLNDESWPHASYRVGPDHFYILYQKNIGGEVPVARAQTVLRVPANLAGEITVTNTGRANVGSQSYWYGAVNPIAYDPAEEVVYFAYYAENQAVGLGVFANNNWSYSLLSEEGLSRRYPSVGLNTTDHIPYVFSNYGIDGLDEGMYHSRWFAFDESGYNGRNFTRVMANDSVRFNNRDGQLYVHNGIWTSEGRLVTGSSIWGDITPLVGYRVNYSDDGGANWSNGMEVFNIFDEGIEGESLPEPYLLAGADNHVFVAFFGKYGTTDFVPPNASRMTLSSFTLGEPWNVTCDLNDANGIDHTDINWYRPGGYPAATASIVADSGSSNNDPFGNGRYYYHIPNDTMNLEAGDSLWFYVFVQDPSGNFTESEHDLIIVNREWVNVDDDATIPVTTTLGQNYPNPFNNSTSIPFALNRSQSIKLQVWDTTGRLVATLHNGQMPAGRHEISWNTEGFSSGVYIYTLNTANGRHIGKMSLIH